MNVQNQGNITGQNVRPKTPYLFYFAMLAVFVLAQNPDWDSNLLWWGSIGLLCVAFFFNYGGTLTVERNYTAWVVAFLFFGTLSFLWAVTPSLVGVALKSMLINTVVLFLIRSAIQSERDIECTMGVALLSIIINSVWLLFTNQAMFSGTTGQEEMLDRLGANSLWNSNSIGMMAAIAMLIALYFRKKTTSKLMRWLYLAVIALMIFVALLSGSRKALLMVLMGLCGFLFVTAKGKRMRMILVIGLLILALYYLVMEIPFFHSIVGWRVEGFLASLTGVGVVDGSAQARDAYITDAIRAWNERPFFGWGLDCYREINLVRRGMYAHNNYVELLADLGMIGTAIYYSAYIYCFAQLIKIKQKNGLVWLLIITLVIFAVMDYGCVSYNLFLNQILIMLMYSLVSIRSKSKAVLVIKIRN